MEAHHRAGAAIGDALATAAAPTADDGAPRQCAWEQGLPGERDYARCVVLATHQAGHGAAATPLCSAPGGAAVVSRQGCLTRGLPTISCRGVTQGRKNPVERPLRPPGSRGHQGHPPPKPAQQAASPDRPRHGSGSGREPHPPLNARASCSGSRPRTVAVSPAVPPQTWPGREPPGNRLKTLGVPYGIRTRVTNVKGWCPGPLDERDGAARW